MSDAVATAAADAVNSRVVISALSCELVPGVNWSDRDAGVCIANVWVVGASMILQICACMLMMASCIVRMSLLCLPIIW